MNPFQKSVSSQRVICNHNSGTTSYPCCLVRQDKTRCRLLFWPAFSRLKLTIRSFLFPFYIWPIQLKRNVTWKYVPSPRNIIPKVMTRKCDKETMFRRGGVEWSLPWNYATTAALERGRWVKVGVGLMQLYTLLNIPPKYGGNKGLKEEKAGSFNHPLNLVHTKCKQFHGVNQRGGGKDEEGWEFNEGTV